jgi:membrane protease YdiL (CAAX protease family)
MTDAVAGTQVTTPRARPRFLRWPLIRILLAILFVMAPFVLLQLALHKLPIDRSLKQIWPAVVSTACCYFMYRAYVRVVEQRAPSEFAGKYGARETGLGFIGGALLFCATLGALYVAGAYRVTAIASWTVMITPFFTMVVIGFLEEILFRGIIFRILQNWLGSWIALALSVVFFVLAHMGNEGATLIGMASVAAAGMLLSAAYMATQRLWLGIGIHIGWNFTQGGLFSVPVSGHPAQGMIQGALSGPTWLTGGVFGVEGSIFAVVTVLAGGIALLRYVAKHQVIAPAWRVAKVNQALDATVTG